ncbi:MAG: bifunctional (p)ppGpp synthetase/guanosine-3',5'-bis(diphosphate) 3'-pyrophosphohydrolase, partial [Burkholderiales bacterium]
LQNGDVVEVVTDLNARPSPAWLGFVRTGKARSEIRHRLRTMQYAESVAMGRRLLDRALATAMIDPARVDEPALERAARDAGAGSVEALYADIGLGRVLAPVVAKSVSLIIGTVAEQVIATSMARAMPMVIRGTEGSTVEYSNCCLPVPGDAIIGQMRGGHGLTLHRAGCRNARRLRARDAERWLEASWAEDIKGMFRSRVVVQVRNERGVLGRVAAEIAASGSNIASVSSEDENEQVSLMRFQLQVRDRVHLARVIRRLRRLPQALKIERV